MKPGQFQSSSKRWCGNSDLVSRRRMKGCPSRSLAKLLPSTISAFFAPHAHVVNMFDSCSHKRRFLSLSMQPHAPGSGGAVTKSAVAMVVESDADRVVVSALYSLRAYAEHKRKHSRRGYVADVQTIRLTYSPPFTLLRLPWVSRLSSPFG